MAWLDGNRKQVSRVVLMGFLAVSTVALLVALVPLNVAARGHGSAVDEWWTDDVGGKCPAVSVDVGHVGVTKEHVTLGEDPDADGDGLICHYVWRVP